MNLQSIRNSNLDYLAKNGIPSNDKLPLLTVPQEKKWKPSNSIAEQLIIAYALTGLAHNADPEKLLKWLKSESIANKLSPVESLYFSENALSEKQINRLSWKQELVTTFAWCLGVQSNLPFPDSESQLSGLFNKIPPKIAVSDFLKNAVRIEKESIFQQVDIYYLYHWALRHPEAWKNKFSLNLDVVIERRRGLEWVIGNAEAIDDVTLDT